MIHDDPNNPHDLSYNFIIIDVFKDKKKILAICFDLAESVVLKKKTLQLSIFTEILAFFAVQKQKKKVTHMLYNYITENNL